MPTIEITQEAYDALQSSKFDSASDAILSAMPKKKAKFDPLQGVPDAVNFEAWSDWVSCRKERRKPLTKRSASMQLKMLSRHPRSVQQQIINSSIQNDYTGLFEPKGGAYGQNQHNRISTAQRSSNDTERLLAHASALEASNGYVGAYEPALPQPLGSPRGSGNGGRQDVEEFQLVAEEDGTFIDRGFRERNG